MTDQELLRAIDAVSEGIEALSGNILEAIAAEKCGWFGCRVKIHAGKVMTVQVSSDQEIHAPDLQPRRPAKKGKSN